MDIETDDAFVEAWVAALPAEAWASPSEPLQPIKPVYALELEWQNGGFHQYFTNPAGNDWPDTLVALERMGASRIKKLFKSALAVFRDSAPSTDHLTRAKQLEDAGQDAIDILDRLDNQYMALYKESPREDSYGKMAEFLRQHGEGPATRCNGPPRRDGSR
jgi:hypothetical protein